MRDGARTRESILAEAVELFAARGVDGTSIRDIAHAVGVAEGALYRHFRSKEEIVRTLFLGHYAALAADVQAIAARRVPFAERLRALIERFAQLFDEHPALFTFLLVNQHRHLGAVPSAPDENPVAAVREVMDRAMAEGDIPAGDPDLAAAMALGLVVQPAVFRIYGRLAGPMGAQVPEIARAAAAALGMVRDVHAA